MHNQTKLISILSEGGFHSGEALGARLGVSRTAVWKTIKKLSEYGLDIHSVRGKGYRLSHAIELLDAGNILEETGKKCQSRIAEIDVFLKHSSTNAWLMAKASPEPDKGHVCFAEMQTEGRGRRGRKWVSPFGENLYLSILWQFPADPQMLSGLGLALSVAIVRALDELGVHDVGLKWPNDVIWNKRKLAGILVEMVAESTGPCRVVMGVGLNINFQSSASQQIDQPWVDLKTILGRTPSRNKIAGVVLRHLLNVIILYEQRGLAPFIEEWRNHDAYKGQRVDILMYKNNISGICEGIDNMGALQVRSGNGPIQKFTSGEISLRGRPAPEQ